MNLSHIKDDFNTQVDDFLKSPAPNLWIEAGGNEGQPLARVYVRKNRLRGGIEVANIEVHPSVQNQGIFSMVLDVVESKAAWVKVENVICTSPKNAERLGSFLVRRGYISDGWSPSSYYYRT